MIKSELLKQVKKIHLNTSEEVLKKLEVESEVLLKKIDHLKSIDVNGIEPMSRIDETPISFLREDVEGEVFPRKFILENAPETVDNYVAIKKVVSND